jgi:hypothetical protein
MKLNDLCEIYSIDNNTNSLIRQSNIDFHTLEDLFDSCLSTNWCLGNLSENDIQLMNDVIQNRGHSFCSLEQCHSRLLVFIETCPTLSNTVKINQIYSILLSFSNIEYQYTDIEIVTNLV